MVRSPFPSSDSATEFPVRVDEYFFYLIHHIQRRRDQLLDETMRDTGLNTARWRTLAVIRRIEDCTMSQLALYSAIDRTTLTRSVDQLVEQQLVERWAAPRDRRQVNLALSAKGEAIFEAVAKVIMAHNASVLEGIDPTALRDTTRTLQSIVRGLSPDARTAKALLNFGPES